MNLNNFENYIEKKILSRGYDYYENNYVTSVEETEENVFEAEVEGTELYTVEVELDDQANIIDTFCDCPYDMDDYCKHQVAAFLAVRDIKNNLSKGNNQISQNSRDSESVLKSPVPKKEKRLISKKYYLTEPKMNWLKFCWISLQNMKKSSGELN